MIIGISGKIGSGKDLAGQLVQYLGTVDNPSFEEFEARHIHFDGSSLLVQPKWEVKKFADALKDCVCVILGCSRKQLEDRDFKEAPLGEEWWLYNLGSRIAPRWSFESGEDNAMAEERYLEKLTPRKILQLLGTEGGRDVIHPNIWVNAAAAGYDGTQQWVFTDMRFPNEFDAVQNRGGITIRLHRGDGNTGDHPSETGLDNHIDRFDYCIDNNGTIEDLYYQIHKIMFDFNLLPR